MTLDDLPADAAPEKEFLLSLGVQSTLAVPLVCGKAAIGFLAISYLRPGRSWAEEDDALLKTVERSWPAPCSMRAPNSASSCKAPPWTSAADAILITDPGGIMLWHNPAFARLTGYAASEIIGKKSNLLKSGKQRPEVYTELWRTITSGQVWRGEIINRRKDGSLYTEQITITPVRGDTGEISNYVAIKQDVTERKQLEAQLRQSQKMQAIGQLAGGVAHDFNNLLAVIRGNIELVLMDQTHISNEARESLGEMASAADRAADLTRQLLTFGRKQAMQARPVDLNELVTNLTKMLRRVIGEDIQLQCRCAARPLLVQADVGMMEQVLTNLIVNSRDAMPRGGRLLVTTEAVLMEAADLRAHSERRPGDFVCLSVTDTGTGIAAEHLPRVFEPFFTTKEPGKGTGLGLATVYGIIERHQGWIEVSSQVDVGIHIQTLPPVHPSAGRATRPRGAAKETAPRARAVSSWSKTRGRSVR